MKNSTLWASVNTRTHSHPAREHQWALFVNAKPLQPADVDRYQIEYTRLETSARGWAALAEITAELLELGYTPSTAWQTTEAGFVCWLDVDDSELEQLLEASGEEARS